MARNLKTEGIIFKSLKYSETSLILDVYTLEKGLESFIVSGVRKSKSKTANVFQPMNIIEFLALDSESKLCRIKEAKLNHIYNELNRNVIKSAIGMFLIDLCRSSIIDKEPNLALYRFIRQSLIEVDQMTTSLAYVPLNFAITLSAYLGFQMQNNYSEDNNCFELMEGSFTAGVQHKYILNKDLSYVLHCVMNGKNTHEITKIERNALLDELLKYYKLHIDGFKELKSLSVLRAILS